jgi:hypothetical protein
MGWQKWAVLIGGGVLMPFTGGASMAIAAPIAGAMDQKEKIEQAKKEQAAATAKAEAALGGGVPGAGTGAGGATPGGAIGGINTAAQALNPYQQLGNQGANALSTLMGFGGTSQPLTAPATAAPTESPMPPSMPSNEPGGHQTLSSLVTDDNAVPEMRPSLARALSARSQSESSYARPNVQGPDGKFYRVPEEQLQDALNNGGRMLPGSRA